MEGRGDWGAVGGPGDTDRDLAAGAVLRDCLEVVLHLLNGSGSAKCKAGRWRRVPYVPRASAGMPTGGVRSTGAPAPGLMLVTVHAVSAARMRD